MLLTTNLNTFLSERLSINRGVFFALAGKFWGTISGVITLAMVSIYYSSVLQGYYYTFLSLLGIQAFFDLSFSTVLTSFVSHEWSAMHITPDRRVAGDPRSLSRVAHLTRFAVTWYSTLGTIFFIGVGIGGFVFLTKKNDPTISWMGPWTILVLLFAVQLSLTPIQAILEGCNQIARVSFVRLGASVAGSIAFWSALFFKLGLWAACLMYGFSVSMQIFLFAYQYGRFFQSLYKTEHSERISWKKEMLPMQWRLGIAGILNCIATSFITPLMFWYHGAKIAGQMGMGWQIMVAAQAISLTWIYAYTPVFGVLISQKKYDDLDRLFYRVTLISLGVLVFLCVSGWIFIRILLEMQNRFALRCMPPGPLALFLLAAIFMHIPQCQSAYLRAHKREPLVLVNVASSLMMGGLVWWFGRRYGLYGAGYSYLGVIALFIMPAIFSVWLRCRREWHFPQMQEAHL